MSVPCVRIIPDIESSFRYFSHSSANVFQSAGSMSSENFMKGLVMIGLHIFFRSGEMFNISFLSVDMTAPDFGSRREDIVPPVIMIATFGRFDLFDVCGLDFVICAVDFSRILASKISDSLIPILYPDFNFRRIVSGVWDSNAWPDQDFVLVWIWTLSPGLNVLVFM